MNVQKGSGRGTTGKGKKDAKKDKGGYKKTNAAPAANPPTKSTRHNWSNEPKLYAAVDEWDNNKPTVATARGEEPVSMRKFAKMRSIPYSVFQRYANPVKKNRTPLGSKAGTKSLLTSHQAELLCQVVIRADRANKGLAPAQIISKIQALNSALSETQARNYFHRTFKKQIKGRIGVSGTADDSTAAWLYHRCESARRKIGTQLSALGLSLVVLNVLHSIQQNDTDYDYDGDDEQYCDVFINALNTDANAMMVDNDFVLDLVGRTKAMLCDKDLTEDELKKFE